MELVDSHAHLVDERFAVDREETIQRASGGSVVRVLTVSVDLATSESTLDLAKRYPLVEPAVGIHPHHAEQFPLEARRVHDLIRESKPRAVGEIGLDYFRCVVPREQQMKAFRTQVEWANDEGLPVVVHDRDAHDDVLAVLNEMKPMGVLHCFSGDPSVLEAALETDAYIGVAGNVTYKNATIVKEVARSVPMDRLLIETDCPSLPPQPWRGQRNEPAYVHAVAEQIGFLRGVTPDVVAQMTGQNARRLFQW